MDSAQVAAIAAAAAQGAISTIMATQAAAAARWLEGRRSSKRKRCKQRPGPVAKLARQTKFEALTREWTDDRFKRKLRLSRRAFQYLVGILEDKLRPQPRARGGAGQRSNAPLIEPDIKVAVALSLLRGASYLDMEQWGLEAGCSVYNSCLWPVVDAINKTPALNMRLLPALEAAYNGQCVPPPSPCACTALPPLSQHLCATPRPQVRGACGRPMRVP